MTDAGMTLPVSSKIPPPTAPEGFNLDALATFDRIDRLRILLGTQWCDCGCRLLDRTPYRTLADLSGLPLGTLNKLAGKGRVYLTRDKLETLSTISKLSPPDVLTILNARETP